MIEQDEFGFTIKDKFAPRISTTLLIIDIVKTKRIEYPNDILTHLWISSYSPPKTLQDIFGGWRIVEARRYYQFSIESILSSFCKYLISFESIGNSFEDFTNVIIKNYKELELFYESLNSVKEIAKRNSLFKNFYDGIISSCKKEKIIEEAIIEKMYLLDKECGYSFNSKYIYYGIILFLLLLDKIPKLNNLNSTKAQDFLKMPYDIRHSFSSVYKLVTSWMQLPFSEAISKIIIELVLKLHLGVSQDKWSQTGNFTFKIIRAEPVGFKLSKESGIMSPNRTSNKILAYLNILIDLEFIHEAEDYYQVTKQGENFYKKYITEKN